MKINLSLCVLPLVIISSSRFVQAETIHTKVAILGGGVSGISASVNLTLAGINDFVMIEARDTLGGRAQNVKFANNVTIELGCNWVQALGSNPINILREKHGLVTAPTNYSDIAYIDDKGKKISNGFEVYNKFQDLYDKVDQLGVKRLKNNLVDLSGRTALSLAGWFAKTPLEEAIEYFTYDWETGETPEVSSMMYVANNDNSNYGTIFGPDSDNDRMDIDQRGFRYIFLQEAAKVFKENDPRLKLNSLVKTIEYDENGVIITTDKDIIIADYAISTFSVGVLQHRDVVWKPEMPDWKMEGIFGFHLATYTKIFMNFPKQFWDDNQFTLYANPTSRGLYSVWQNMNAPGYFPKGTDNNIFFVTVTQDYAYMVEAMTDDQVKEQLMDVLRKMYGDDIPEPTDFVFPRWHSNPLFRGSYSNWPIGEMNQHHENMKAPLHNRVFFAGEAMSKDFFGYLQGAWISGEETATHVIQCIKSSCPKAYYYPEIQNNKIPGVTVNKREI
ncbi:uncharacterized protein BX664DRAFT_375578 [Halteromyces radiatus]|uniref:uncharacterized protein n=1 Tax=Halteromyces radiatus TaxID=101107 RepID=UPI00221FEB34|nr:uncharacterized protein BX664DRAFT_375578 [Halteromyces radiatus]KAI8085106.1 hypothetical protein BX664DRAFT_375578 [Halteromyces radiatus]